MMESGEKKEWDTKEEAQMKAERGEIMKGRSEEEGKERRGRKEKEGWKSEGWEGGGKN